MRVVSIWGPDKKYFGKITKSQGGGLGKKSSLTKIFLKFYRFFKKKFEKSLPPSKFSYNKFLATLEKILATPLWKGDNLNFLSQLTLHL